MAHMGTPSCTHPNFIANSHEIRSLQQSSPSCSRTCQSAPRTCALDLAGHDGQSDEMDDKRMTIIGYHRLLIPMSLFHTISILNTSCFWNSLDQGVLWWCNSFILHARCNDRPMSCMTHVRPVSLSSYPNLGISGLF